MSYTQSIEIGRRQLNDRFRELPEEEREVLQLAYLLEHGRPLRWYRTTLWDHQWLEDYFSTLLSAPADVIDVNHVH